MQKLQADLQFMLDKTPNRYLPNGYKRMQLSSTIKTRAYFKTTNSTNSNEISREEAFFS